VHYFQAYGMVTTCTTTLPFSPLEENKPNIANNLFSAPDYHSLQYAGLATRLQQFMLGRSTGSTYSAWKY